MSWLGAPTPLSAATAAAALPSSLRHRARHAGGSEARSASGSGPSSPTTIPGSASSTTAASTPLSARPRGRRKTKGASVTRLRDRLNRGLVQAAFKQFGEHCARNQIRTLLIDCLVMTNLFYPSFAMFLDRHWGNAQHTGVPQARAPNAGPSNGAGTCGDEPSRCTPCWLFNGGVGETFFPAPPPLVPNVEWGPWWAADGGAAAGDAQWVPAPVGGSLSGASVDLLRVAWADVGDVLDAEHDVEWTPRDDQIVSAVRSLAEDWDSDGSEAARCVRHLVDRDGVARPDGPCYLIAPRDSAHIRGSTDLTKLWGRGNQPEQQMYRGVIVPFHRPTNYSSFEAAWTRRIGEIMSAHGAEVFTETYAGGKSIECSTLVSFSSKPAEPTPEPISSTPPRFVLVLYGVLFVALLFQLSNATKVHSRFGLAFTGIVQLCCSTVMSFSVLALLGWNGWGWSKGQTVLPTYSLPFVIVVVGAENMSALTKAVFSVPFTYSVPVRIGIGLSKVGSTIALTSLTDLALLGLVWLCVHLQPVREFCVFAAVVIVTDWFMLHTFFLTVLSIDAQRLELADVLVSGGGLTAAEVQKREDDKEKRRASRKSTRFSWRSVLRARTAKSGSLLLLLTSVGVLYYYTESGRTKFSTPAAALYGYKPSSTTSLAPSARPSMLATTGADLRSLSTSESLWRSLNPQGLNSVRIVQPPSSIVVFPRVGHSLLPADLRKMSLPVKSFKLPRLEPLLYWVKMGLLPQAATSFALYALLLYLLKDSELLHAQRNRLGRDGDPHGSDEETDDGGHKVSTTTKASVTTGVGVHMLPASHESDVDVIATSADGLLAVSVGVDNSICLWRFTDDDQVSGTREIVPTAFIPPGDPIVAAAASCDSQYAAIVTRGGLVQLWSTPADDRKTEPLGPVHVGSEGLRVVALAFDDSPSSAEDPFTASPTGRGPQGRPTLLVATSDGAIQAIAPGNRVVDIAPPASREKGAICCVDILSTNTGPIAIVSGPNRISMWRKEQGEWSSALLMSSCEPSDRVTAAATGLVDWQRPTDFVAIARRSGRIEVFDEDGDCVAEFGQDGDPVWDLAVSAPSTTKCSTCDSRSTDGFFVVSSTTDHVYVDRIVPRRADTFCRCPPLPRRSSAIDDAFGRIASSPVVLPPSPARARTVSGGFTRSVISSPMKGGALAPPPSNGDYALSPHGARRLSGWRENAEPPRPPSPLDRQGSYTALSTLSMSAPEDSLSSPARAWDEAEVIPLGAVVATDGGWAILDHNIVGIRRAGAGIDDSQWHLWAVDLNAPWNGSSLLVDAAGLDVLERRTRTTPRTGYDTLAPPTGEMPMRARRAERILSLNGRASFPSAVGSFTIPTHQPLGYVAVRPFRVAGRRTLLAGFGNRVGVVTIPVARTRAPPVPALNLPPRPNYAASPRVVTPRRQPAPPPRRNEGSANGHGNGNANGSAQNGNGNGLYPSPPKN